MNESNIDRFHVGRKTESCDTYTLVHKKSDSSRKIIRRTVHLSLHSLSLLGFRLVTLREELYIAQCLSLIAFRLVTLLTAFVFVDVVIKRS